MEGPGTSPAYNGRWETRAATKWDGKRRRGRYAEIPKVWIVQRHLAADAGDNSDGGQKNATACVVALFIQTA